MGLIREALRVPRLDGEEADAEAAVVRLVDGSAVGVAVPYEMVTRLIFGQRPITGPPRGFRIDEKRGWLMLRPPVVEPEDEGVFPLTAIVAILPLFPEDLDYTEENPHPEFEDPYYEDPAAGANGNGYVGGPSDDHRPG